MEQQEPAHGGKVETHSQPACRRGSREEAAGPGRHGSVRHRRGGAGPGSASTQMRGKKGCPRGSAKGDSRRLTQAAHGHDNQLGHAAGRRHGHVPGQSGAPVVAHHCRLHVGSQRPGGSSRRGELIAMAYASTQPPLNAAAAPHLQQLPACLAAVGPSSVRLPVPAEQRGGSRRPPMPSLLQPPTAPARCPAGPAGLSECPPGCPAGTPPPPARTAGAARRAGTRWAPVPAHKPNCMHRQAHAPASTPLAVLMSPALPRQNQ